MHTLPIPIPESPLSQVVFVHDYMQLVFQDEVLTIYNAPAITVDGVQYVMGAAGFGDQAMRLIELSVTSVSEALCQMLELRFEGGARLNVPVGEATSKSPEAYMFSGKNGLVIVEPNR